MSKAQQKTTLITIRAALRIGFGLLAIAAVIVQFIDGTSRPNFDVGNFFSFFTIESNLIAAVLLIVAGILNLRGVTAHKNGPMLRGAATFYMATTGIIFSLLLSGLQDTVQTPLAWVNFVLHYLMPAAVVLDWFTDLPRTKVPFKQAAVWLAFPLAYFVYSLIRGSITGWYPYPFLNPTLLGYEHVFLSALFIGVGAVAAVWALSLTTGLRKSK